MDYKKIGDELKKKLQEIKISRDKLNSKDFYKDSDNLSTLKPPKKVIHENISKDIIISKPKLSDLIKTIFNISDDDSSDSYSEWYSHEIGKYITFMGSRNLYPILNREEYGCQFGFSYEKMSFIHPYGGSFYIDLTGEILTLRGYYTNNKRRVEESLFYLMSSKDRDKNININDKDEYETFTDDNNPFINVSSISPRTNRIIELTFKTIKIINNDTLELSPVNLNSELFTFNRKSTIWERTK